MRRLIFLTLLFAMAAASSAQQATPFVYPRHIEVPVSPYPAIARVAHVSGEVVVKVTIDTDGTVVLAEVVSGSALLRRASTDNVQHWTFSPPPHSRFTQTVTYEYKLEAISGDRDAPTKVSFDLPDRVTIVAPVFTVQPQE
jgi:TonB family protein